MAVSEYEKNKSLRKYLCCSAFLLLGICIGLLAAWGIRSGNGGQGSDTAGADFPNQRADSEVAESDAAGADIRTAGADGDAVATNAPGVENIDLIVDYPFSYSLEGWQLILHEDDAESEGDHARSGREFRLYNGDGQLVQAFPCGLEAEELVFQFDHLFYYYTYDKDLVVFPADASETGAKGLCYPWDNEADKFSEEPVEIPWYQKIDYDNAFLTTETKGNTVINTLCRINEESRQVVELRKWTLTGKKQDGRGTLQIRDCLTGQDLYVGEVEWNSLDNLVNDKYYQYLFRQDLDHFWDWTNDNEIEATKVTHDSFEAVTYQNRGELLADCGFAGKEPFYEYYDSFHRLEMELFFDEQTGHGCGILYAYNYNYALEQVARCWGFAFDQVTREKWESEDTFSTLSVYGDDARGDNISGYKEIYEYTDDGKLSSFEARGIIGDYGEDEEKTESKLLSMDYVYRNDGTLYHKQYYHHHILFGTTYGSRSCYYDEQGQIVCNYSYVTHGSYSYYYIYRDGREQPSYCLMLDSGGGVWPDMISYGN